MRMDFFGPPYRTRTCNRQNRNLILYPIEPRADMNTADAVLFFYFSIISSMARASWSGHDVPLPPQSVPRRRFTTSSAFMPTTRADMPFVLPLQPPVNFTSFITPSSIVISIWREQTPFGLYTDVFVILIFPFRCFPRIFLYILPKKAAKNNSGAQNFENFIFLL